MSIGPIQTLPYGLNALLGLKGQQGVHLLNEEVIATVDMVQQYLMNFREQINFGTVAAPVAGGNSFAGGTNPTVPPGELWYVWYYQVSAVCGAGAAARITPCLTTQGPGSLSFASGRAGTAAANEFSRVKSDAPMWAAQGDTFVVLIEQLTLTPTIGGQALISRLRV